MKKSAAVVDDRQGVIPIDLPPGPRLSSDEKARGELLTMVELSKVNVPPSFAIPPP